MSRLIVDALFLKSEVSIAALLAVSPGFKTALTPWYVTKNGNRTFDPKAKRIWPPSAFSHTVDFLHPRQAVVGSQTKIVKFVCTDHSYPLTWKMIKFLHRVSPFSFQFATSLSIVLKTEKEVDAFLTSKAAKSLFHQLETLYLQLSLFSSKDLDSLVQFIHQFGLLQTCRLDFRAERGLSYLVRPTLPQSKHIAFFCNILSSNQLMRNRSLALSLVSSLQFYRNINAVLDCHRQDNSFLKEERELLTILISLMREFFKHDDGTSFVMFLNIIAQTLQPSRRPECTEDDFRSLLPLFELLENIIVNGDFNKVISRSNCRLWIMNTLVHSDALDAASTIVEIIDWVVKSKNSTQKDQRPHYFVVSQFTQRFGKVFVNELPRIIWNTFKDENGQLSPCLRKKGTHEFTFFNKKIRDMFNPFIHLTDIIKREESAFVTDVFPVEVFYDFIQFCDCSETEFISNVVCALMKAASNGESSLFLSTHQCRLSDIACRMYDHFINYKPKTKVDKKNKWARASPELYTVDELTYVWSDMLKGLAAILFGWTDSDDALENHRFNEAFHKSIRQSFFGVKNLVKVNEILDWVTDVVLPKLSRVVELYDCN